MKLVTILNDLMSGEFSQLNILARGAGVIDDDNLSTVVSHINRGLTDLFTRFELKLSSLTLAPQPDQTTYQLTSKHAVNGRGAVEPFYILDTAGNPFKDDVLRISRVNTDCEKELPLNRLDVAYSLLTSAMDRLEVPLPIVNKSLALPKQYVTNNLRVWYHSNHPILNPDIGAFDPERLEIELPYSHMTALLYFVASRATNPVGLGQEFNAGNTYAAKYEAECLRLKNDGMEIQQRSQDETKFQKRGFV